MVLLGSWQIASLCNATEMPGFSVSPWVCIHEETALSAREMPGPQMLDLG